ncbi:glutamyl aminopeptidase-like isoform X2 [Artemia franciscana]|uniref:glutamyl aminopeptidase-like isoform X2 n=1 Tax=Artemia franciscana TaxID=6661 RepID=UPI0032DB1B8E
MPAVRDREHQQAAANRAATYEKPIIASCTPKQAIIVLIVVIASSFLISIIIAFARPIGCQYPEFIPPPLPKGYRLRKPSANYLTTTGEAYPWKDIRLPKFIRPLKYRIQIRPNLTTRALKGQMGITFYVTEETNFIILHSRNLTINEYLLRDVRGKELTIRRSHECIELQQIYLETRGSLFPYQNYTLGIRFDGNLTESLEGVYMSKYTNSKNRTRFLAVTHFEPTYARAAFPCFDEPHLKAKFKISIIRHRDHFALSNMPLEKTEDVGFFLERGLLQDHFQETVQMSTYLVAFVVCDFSKITNKTSRGVSVSVYAPPDQITQASFALDVATKVMDFYEDFFGVPYPLPKLDLVAVPDFGAGAMENWGLVTYREAAILVDPEQTSTKSQQYVAIVIAHELAHQWFGNLVTMDWWNELWLNEGFASFLEYKAVNSIIGNWRMMDQFILEKTQTALALDELSTSHPVSVSVDDPSEIESIFDAISYNKGASILYMLEGVLGEEIFKQGLTNYLETNKYLNTVSDNFWECLSIAARNSSNDVHVKTIMDTWTQQMGFPLIYISRDEKIVHVKQEMFPSIFRNSNDPERPNSTWKVPVSFVTSIDPTREFHLWLNGSSVDFEVPDSVVWFKMNSKQSGFYRVMYEESLWAQLTDILLKNHTSLSAADRASLLDDAFTLNRVGILNVSTPLLMLKYLEKERDHVPWATALRHLNYLQQILSLRKAKENLVCFIQKLITPVYNELGWKLRTKHVEKLLQEEILSAAVKIGMVPAISQATKLFQQWRGAKTPISPDLREIVYSTGIRYGDKSDWDTTWKKLQESKISSEKRLLLKALGSAMDPWLIQRYLEFTLDQNKIRSQDIRTVVDSVAQNSPGNLLTWRFVKLNWNKLLNVEGGIHSIGPIVNAATSRMATNLELSEVEAFFSKADVGHGHRLLDQSLETIRNNIFWLEKSEDLLGNWIKSNTMC